MDVPRKITVVVLLLYLWGGLTGCKGPAGWERLWKDGWNQVQLGERWERGVVANDLRFEGVGGARFRTTLVNVGDATREVELARERTVYSWTVPAQSVVHVDVELPMSGAYSVSDTPDVWLGFPRIGRPIRNPRMIVFVLVDTLRNDHVNEELMPNVLSAFAPGHRWNDTIANASWTLPSVASIFTARPVLDLTTPSGDVVGIPQGHETWADVFDREGFAGGGFVANYTVHALNGFSSGFGTFLVPDGDGGSTHPDVQDIVTEAQSWLTQHRGEDAFVYVHLMDPHEPYRDHEGSGEKVPRLQPLGNRVREASPYEVDILRRRYAGEVRHVDDVLGPFLESLSDSAVVVLTADHGESLGEHESWAHGLTVFNPEISVPLLLKGPGVVAGVSEEPVQLVDLAPTLLELGGYEPPLGMLGRSLLHGGSDLPMVSATFGPGPLRWSLRKGSAKYVLHTAPQPGIAVEARTKMPESRPLETGLFFFDLATDFEENSPGPVDGDNLDQFITAFVESVGRMVPRLQIAVLGQRGQARLRVELGAAFEPVQAFSIGPMTCLQDQKMLEITCENAFPVCLVAGSTETTTWIRPITGGLDWLGVQSSEETPVDQLGLPEVLETGKGLLWWNPSRDRVVDGFDETIERLKALGYLE
ncbi:MAG: sulfatase [bacterium]|nr:sulfatase [bacterium]